jgi:hypothetical protein
MRPNYYHFRAVDEDGSAQEWLVDDYEKYETQIQLFRKNLLVQTLEFDDGAMIERLERDEIH